MSSVIKMLSISKSKLLKISNSKTEPGMFMFVKCELFSREKFLLEISDNIFIIYLPVPNIEIFEIYFLIEELKVILLNFKYFS